MIKITYNDIKSPKTLNLVKEKKSFEIIGLSGRISNCVTEVENIIEIEGFSCRTYTYGRITSVGASFLGGITGVAGVFSGIGIAAHNLATYNPDYELAKHIVDNRLSVRYMK